MKSGTEIMVAVRINPWRMFCEDTIVTRLSGQRMRRGSWLLSCSRCTVNMAVKVQSLTKHPRFDKLRNC
jgi:hypothetical protein